MTENYRCQVCTRKLEPYGTGGMACSEGHHFIASEVRGTQPRLATVRHRQLPIHPWLPGSVLGGIALLIEAVRILG